MAKDDASKKGCLYVAAGCGVVGVLAAIGIGALTFWGYGIAKDIEDPAVRQAKVLEVLGASSLPPGYFPVIGLELPFDFFSMAIITDREVELDGKGRDGRGHDEKDLGEHVLIYLETAGKDKDRDELEDFFSGKTDNPRVLEKNDVEVDVQEVLGRGRLELAAFDLRYVAARGETRVEDRHADGLTTLMLLECRGDAKKLRFGIWTGPDPSIAPAIAEATDPAIAAALEAPSRAGTLVDPDVIGAFMGHFDPCR